MYDVPGTPLDGPCQECPEALQYIGVLTDRLHLSLPPFSHRPMLTTLT